MSQADQIVESGKIPAEWEDGAANVQDLCIFAWTSADDAPAEIPAVRFQREEDGTIALDEDGTQILVLLVDEDNHPIMEQHPLLHRAEHHGLHAYRYEVCDDGSTVALYANTREGTLKLKSFDSLEEASRWTPRDER